MDHKEVTVNQKWVERTEKFGVTISNRRCNYNADKTFMAMSDAVGQMLHYKSDTVSTSHHMESITQELQVSAIFVKVASSRQFGRSRFQGRSFKVKPIVEKYETCTYLS